MAPNIMNLAVRPLSVQPSFFPSSSFFSPWPLSVRALLLLLAASSSSLSKCTTFPREELVVCVPFLGGRPILLTGPPPLPRGLSRAEEAGTEALGESRRGSASATGEIVTGLVEMGASRDMVRVGEGEVTEEGVMDTEECEEEVGGGTSLGLAGC